MRFSEKGFKIKSGENQLFGVNFQDIMQNEESNMFELATEFHLTLRDVRKLKKRLERS
ncbi:hypothetical protein H1Z61_15125 [Bacillus aquiflavi]|uniref:RNA polymerase subunit sigma-70 n=1 Tax=Bacillus aquiflavi TaxID=2672567 RepID=A0A7W2AGA9_9BACI|nr:hypothetical protein [Bacillus aquiflavi]MBA4538428.1 hypothetical protein [Bacillus aquiflavi]UAC47372.1 hypothetical protein K6959_11720 [Bacillus aquiflavi]